MSIRQLTRRWQGPLLSLIGIVATLWLGATGQLALYIHPRYFEFTVVLALIAGALVVASFAVVPVVPVREGAREGSAGEPAAAAGKRDRLWSAGSMLIIAAAAAGLLILPPSTLTSATVNQRGINGSASVLSESDPGKLVGGDYSTFTVKDWASLLRQGAGQDFLSGKTATVTGFVTPDKSDPANVFLVSRFVITCCAVDAQPVGIPVYRPGWQNQFKADSWVTLSSSFHSSPTNSNAIVLIPETITSISQPAQPYVY